jgi:hypothetical protein
VLIVCDPRIGTASYRKPFVEALPVALRFERDPGVLAASAAEFLNRPVTVEES